VTWKKIEDKEGQSKEGRNEGRKGDHRIEGRKEGRKGEERS
jgi:hypothetical protein